MAALNDKLEEIAPLLRSYIKELQDVHGCGNVLYVDGDHAGGTNKTITFTAGTHAVTVSDT